MSAIGRAGLGWSQQPGTPCSFPMWVFRTHVLEVPSVAHQGMYSWESELGSREETQAQAVPQEMWLSKQQISLLCHSSCWCSMFWAVCGSAGSWSCLLCRVHWYHWPFSSEVRSQCTGLIHAYLNHSVTLLFAVCLFSPYLMIYMYLFYSIQPLGLLFIL